MTDNLPPGNKLFSRECRFVAGVSDLSHMPEMTLPEIVFCGRSNVGKSSLINAVLHRKHLVRTSHTPGHTRQLNFFNLDETLMLVDVPGYGYAKASKADVKRWQAVLFAYLRARPQILRVMLLIDARHGIKAPDEEMMKLLDDAAVTYQVVMTKTDKATEKELAQARLSVEKAIAKHPAAFPSYVSTSAHAVQGIEGLQSSILGLLASLDN